MIDTYTTYTMIKHKLKVHPKHVCRKHGMGIMTWKTGGRYDGDYQVTPDVSPPPLSGDFSTHMR